MRSGTFAVLRRRLLGVTFIAVFATIIGLCVAIYNDAFQQFVPVTVQTDRVGNQLQELSDVKVRGLIVGQVADVQPVEGGAVVNLQLEPNHAASIPRNVSARLLPKTLFGERFVSLVIPPQPSPQPLQPGDVIPQDRSQVAIELERVLNGLLPLLTAVRPAQLASTLNALSDTLEGRGETLGDTLVLAQRYLSQLNTALPELQEDLTRLAQLTETYSEAAPDLVDALADLTVTSRTVAEQRLNLQTMYATLTTAADDTSAFLRANRSNIIALSAESRPTLELLARYAPEFPCLLNLLTNLRPRLNQVFGAGTDEPGLHIKLEITQNRGPYEPNQDEPEYLDKRGPRCYAEYTRPENQPPPQYPPDGPIQDGSLPPPAADNKNNAMPAGQVTPQAVGFDLGLPNSPAEQQLVASLLAAATGRHPKEIPGWSTLLVGPLLRGTEVSLG